MIVAPSQSFGRPRANAKLLEEGGEGTDERAGAAGRGGDGSRDKTKLTKCDGGGRLSREGGSPCGTD